MLGTQAETIYLDFSTRKLAGYGIDIQALIKALQNQNAVSASGVVQAGPERVSLRVSGSFTSEKSLQDVTLRVNDRFFRLADAAEISRGYEAPPSAMFRVDGRPAIGPVATPRPGFLVGGE